MVVQASIRRVALALVCTTALVASVSAVSWAFSVLSDAALVLGFFAALIAGHA